jgi:hypothetical protein
MGPALRPLPPLAFIHPRKKLKIPPAKLGHKTGKAKVAGKYLEGPEKSLQRIESDSTGLKIAEKCTYSAPRFGEFLSELFSRP